MLRRHEAAGQQDDPNAPLVTCSADLSTKYILGPVEVDGSDIKSATAGLQQLQNGGTSTDVGDPARLQR